MDLMREFPDKYFDLAIVDPPYGLGETWKKDRFSKFYTHESTYKNDRVPGPDYFAELFRVSKNQIVWGANYYTQYLPTRNSWIVWDKNRSFDDSHMAEGELAWTSFNIPLLIARFTWNGFIRCEARDGNHPYEKPTKLYRWTLEQYAKPSQKILDTHLGSGSIAIAAHYFGAHLTACEIDPDYFREASARILRETAQLAFL